MAGLLSRARIEAEPGLQPLAGAARRPRHPPQHRPGLRLQRLQAAADARCSASPSRRRATGSRPSWPGSSRIAIVFLGLSAAVFGRWLERAGPRKSGCSPRPAASARGFLVSAARRPAAPASGCSTSATACSAACGLGLGYISPVSTLIKWFPDRRGMATGMAIMGFGGGAMIASPLSQLAARPLQVADLGRAWPRRSSRWALIYFVVMMFGAFLFRVPAPGWKPAGWEPPRGEPQGLITRRRRHTRTRRSGRRSSICSGRCCSST